MPKWIIKLLSKRKLRLSYSLDDAAKIAKVLTNKPEPYWTEEDHQQVTALVSHFRSNLSYTVLVEDK